MNMPNLSSPNHSASGFVAATVLQFVLYNTVGRSQFDTVDWSLFAADVLVCAVLFGLAINANRLWPCVATAFMIFSVAVSHVFRGTLEGWLGLTYAYLNVLPTLFAVATLFVGAAVNMIRRKRGYQDPD